MNNWHRAMMNYVHLYRTTNLYWINQHVAYENIFRFVLQGIKLCFSTSHLYLEKHYFTICYWPSYTIKKTLHFFQGWPHCPFDVQNTRGIKETSMCGIIKLWIWGDICNIAFDNQDLDLYPNSPMSWGCGENIVEYLWCVYVYQGVSH